MLLQPDRVSEINFPSIWRPKIKKISLWCPPWEHFMETIIYASIKETQSLEKNSCTQKYLDKSLAISFPFTPLTAQKMKISKQWQKGLEISFYTSVTKIMIICYTVPEIWHELDVIVILRFGQFSALPPPPNIFKNENFTKIIIEKTTTGGINKCTRNHDHMLYCSWDMVCDRCNCYFSIWVNSPKNENFKTMEKTPWDIIILQKCTKNHGHMLYCYWDIVRDGCNCYFSFWGIFFALLSPH